MSSWLSWIPGFSSGSSNAQTTTARGKAAQGSFVKEELSVLRQTFADVSSGSSVLVKDQFLHLCGLPSQRRQEAQYLNAGFVGEAVYQACIGVSEKDYDVSISSQAGSHSSNSHQASPGVSVNDLIVAKAECERLGSDSSYAFAFRLLQYLAAVCRQRSQATPSQTQDLNEGVPFQDLQHCLTALLEFMKVCRVQQQQQGSQPHTTASQSEPTLFSVKRQQNDTGPTASTTHVSSSPSLHTSAQDVTGTNSASPSSSKAISISMSNITLDSVDDETVWAVAAARGALWTAAGPASAQPAAALTATGYVRWVKAIPVWHSLLSNLFSGVRVSAVDVAMPAPGPVPHASSQQHLDSPQNKSSTSTSTGARDTAHGAGAHVATPCPKLLGALPQAGLLQPTAAQVLCSCMPASHRREWRLVYNSDKDGKSFSTLMGKLSTVEGATLVLVREGGADGHVVAGCGPAPWRKSGTFFGDHTTWVARLLPDMQVFQATGSNTNFQWCGQGFAQLTNGLGFGGAQGSVSAFALLLDSTLDQGQSRPIATFGSPSLTKSQTFQIACVEVWLVQQPEEQEQSSHGKSTSVLDKAKEDRLIMDLAGRQVNHSAGYRDEPLE